MTLITTTLAALMLVSSLSVTNSATTIAATTTTAEYCIITLASGFLVIPIGEARSVTYNNGKDYVIYNCTDTTVSTPGDAYVCESAKCAYRTSTTMLHTCQNCVLLYNAVSNCIDTDGVDCTDTDMCTNNPNEGTTHCCKTCKDYLNTTITTTTTTTP